MRRLAPHASNCPAAPGPLGSPSQGVRGQKGAGAMPMLYQIALGSVLMTGTIVLAGVLFLVVIFAGKRLFCGN